MTHNIIWKHRKSHNSSSLTTKIKLQYIFWLRFGSANAINICCVARGENFNLEYLLIEFVMLNFSQIYFCIPQIFKKNFSSRFFSKNRLLNLCSSAENSQSYEIFILKHSANHIIKIWPKFLNYLWKIKLSYKKILYI